MKPFLSLYQASLRIYVQIVKNTFVRLYVDASSNLLENVDASSNLLQKLTYYSPVSTNIFS